MKQKLLLLAAFASFFFCYLEWGPDNHAFVYDVEYLVLFQKSDKAANFSHPFILIPFCGQLLLLVALFQKPPRRALVFTGLALTGILVLFLLLVGVLSKNPKIIFSTLPFLAAAIWYVRLYRKSINSGSPVR